MFTRVALFISSLRSGYDPCITLNACEEAPPLPVQMWSFNLVDFAYRQVDLLGIVPGVYKSVVDVEDWDQKAVVFTQSVLCSKRGMLEYT